MRANGDRGRVLISEPCSWDMAAMPYLPYVWGTLKTYAERHGGQDGRWEWLDPIYLQGDAETLLAPHAETPIDVLGLSCYIWNWELQCRIAREVKRRNPHCLVIAGGPQPDYKDPAFFQKHPEIDVVVVKDGEITFSRLLQKMSSGDRAFLDVGGLYLPGEPESGHVFTGPAAVPDVFDDSPYIAQADHYERLIQERRGRFSATWETTRGCPYGCSFCDWGSSTLSKVRRFGMERVRAELDWLARHRPTVLFLADANFGLLPRDLEIADLIVEARRTYHYPRFLVYSQAKNAQERSVEISKKLFDAGILWNHELAIQHTRKEVLAATDRSNISAEKQVEVVRQLMAHRIPIEVQLILGIPGDSYALWKSCLGDLMEWGIHSNYLIYLYHLLPNAPAADPAFMAKWKVDTIERHVFSTSDVKRARAANDPIMVRNRIVVGSATYTRDDWIRMNVYGAFVRALHSCSVTQLLARYLRKSHGVPFEAFYGDLVDVFCQTREPARTWHDTVSAHYRAFLGDESAVDRMDLHELPNYAFQVSPAQWIFVQACLQLDDFFAALEEHLCERYPSAVPLRSLLQFQRESVILPDYDARFGKTFRMEYDWISYFAAEQRGVPLAGCEPSRLDAQVDAADQTCTDGVHVYPLDWHLAAEPDRWSVWIDRTVLRHNCVTRNNLQALSLRVAPAAARTGLRAPRTD